MAEEFETVDIWLGLFPSQDRLDKYFDEQYSDDDDETPISEFARDQGVWFYDHDLVERSFHENGENELGLLIGRHSFSASFIESVLASFQTSRPFRYNAAVLVWGKAI